MKLNRLIQLNAKLDEVIQFRSYDANGNEIDDDSHGLRNAAIGTGVVGAGAAGLYGAGAGKFGINAGEAAGMAGKDLKNIFTGNGVSQSAKNIGGMIGTGAGRVGTALKGAGSSLLQKLRGIKWSARHSQLVQLNARLDEVINFEKEPDEDDKKEMKGKKKTKGKFIFGKKKA